MALPLGLTLYRIMTRLVGPNIPELLQGRVKRGKEDPHRIDERFGKASAARPEGKLVWIHGASVGESLISLSLKSALEDARQDVTVLLTSGTVTSAQLIAQKSNGRALHQYLPVDRLIYVTAFLDHWDPDLAIFVESELWPNLIVETARRGTPMALANARMNETSLKHWNRFEQSAKWLFGCFDWIGAADNRTAEGLSALTGRDIPMVGNLKLNQISEALDEDKLTELTAAIGDRPVWLAASTHEGEEEILLGAHKRLLQDNPDGLMLMAPRHPERGPALKSLIEAQGLSVAVRSAGESPGSDTQVWLVDTLGEMAYWYTLAPASFIGGSLREGIGGHNPIEASQAGTGIMTGPFTASFDDVYKVYDDHQARGICRTADEIAQAVDYIRANISPIATRNSDTLHALGGTGLEHTLKALNDLMREEAE